MKRLLEGKPLGQTLHTLLVHMPIGLLVFSFVLDIINLPRQKLSPSVPLAICSFYMIGLGLIGMVIAAIPGLVDYTAIRADSPAKRKGWTHLWVNALAFLAFSGSFLTRWTATNRVGPAVTPFALSVFGVGFLGFAGYLGGQMIYHDGIGVGRHRRTGKTPLRTLVPTSRKDDYVAVAKVGDMQDRQTLRVDVNGTIVAVARVDGEYYAFQEFCTHRFGPLSEGCFKDGQVMCPWHRSMFDMRTGQVMQGPAKMPIKTFEVMVRNGEVLVRTVPKRRVPSTEARPGTMAEQAWKSAEEEERRQRLEPRVDADGNTID
jgi:nitrite reductase/ring-hydroxylating ferredoxin subunit/uncharacterized membrane protein